VNEIRLDPAEYTHMAGWNPFIRFLLQSGLQFLLHLRQQLAPYDDMACPKQAYHRRAIGILLGKLAPHERGALRQSATHSTRPGIELGKRLIDKAEQAAFSRSGAPAGTRTITCASNKPDLLDVAFVAGK
jgi:hypothetical protein